MTDTSQIQSKAVSRRTILLRGAACTAGAAALLGPVTHANAGKMTKKVVAYQDTPKGDEQCSNCVTFVPPNACNFVEGDVSPTAWCKIWTKTS